MVFDQKISQDRSRLFGVLWSYSTDHKIRIVREAFVCVCLKLQKPTLETLPSFYLLVYISITVKGNFVRHNTIRIKLEIHFSQMFIDEIQCSLDPLYCICLWQPKQAHGALIQSGFSALWGCHDVKCCHSNSDYSASAGARCDIWCLQVVENLPCIYFSFDYCGI